VAPSVAAPITQASFDVAQAESPEGQGFIKRHLNNLIPKHITQKAIST